MAATMPHIPGYGLLIRSRRRRSGLESHFGWLKGVTTLTKFRISILASVFWRCSRDLHAPPRGTEAGHGLFTGKYKGTATTQVDGTAATISANGTGTRIVIGAGSITGLGTGDTSQQPCLPFTRHRYDQGRRRNHHLQGRPRLAAAAATRAVTPSASPSHHHRAEGDGEAGQGEGHPQDDGHLQP